MSLIEVARDALKEIPLADVLRERVSLALDQLADAQRQVEVLQTEKGSLNAQLERERADHEQTKKELQRLSESLHEEIRFVRDVEFRKGNRTGHRWMPFCPKCHLPLANPDGGGDFMKCSDYHECAWISNAIFQDVEADSRRLL